jgi:hypothetical protein
MQEAMEAAYRDVDPATMLDITSPTEGPTRRFQRHTEPSAGEGGLVIRVVDPAGRQELAIRCRSIRQCREVVRVEAPIHEPYTMFFIADGSTPVERWAVGRDGLPKRGRR